MNSSFVAISTLVKSNIGEQCLISIFMNMSTQSLRDYLECANIYKGKASKKKTYLVKIPPPPPPKAYYLLLLMKITIKWLLLMIITIADD